VSVIIIPRRGRWFYLEHDRVELQRRFDMTTRGAKEIEPPIWMIIFSTALRRRSLAALN
jgi:hypothetical protein